MGPRKVFPATSGLRQGDLLSPFLLIMVADSLSQILKFAENNGLFKGFQVGSDKIKVSHLQFADETLLFMQR